MKSRIRTTEVHQLRNRFLRFCLSGFLLSLLLCLYLMTIASAEQWSETAPDSIYIEKIQYRSRSVSTETVYSAWNDWISNGKTAISATDLRDVRTVAHAAQTKTVYTYDHYKYYNTSYNEWRYSYVDNSGNSWSTQGRWETAQSDTPYTQYKWASNDGYDGWRDSSNIPWFHQATKQVTVTSAYTEYQYRTRTASQKITYGEWSEWSDNAVTATDSLDVETRTVYAVDTSKLTSGIRIGTVSELPMFISTGCQIQYKGNENNSQWTSTNNSVASVNQSGYVSAHSAGTAVISVELSSGETYSISVIVKDWQGLKIPALLEEVRGEAFSGGSFEYADLTCGIVRAVRNKAFSDNSRLKLVKANNQIAFGDDVFAGCDHVVMACEGEGSVTDYAEAEGIPYYVIGAEINYQPISSVVLSASSATIVSGDTYQLSCEVYPSDATNQSVTWSSSDPSVAAVSPDGLVSAISNGTAVITVASRSDHSIKAECTITVLPILVESVSLNKQSITIYTGNSQSIIATVLPAGANNKTLYWASSNEAVASVDRSGVVKGKGTGTATITATTTDGSEISASCTVTVKSTTVVDDSKFTTVYVDGITATNAVIHTKVSLPHNPTSAGYYFGTSSSNLVLSATEDSSGMPLNNQIIWYNLNKWGKTLSPGTTYYYQFYIVYDGITYKTSVRSFKTSGTAGVVVDDSMFTTIYVEGITETNAVIHTKVSLPHNPTKAGYYFGTSASNLTLSATEDASGMPLSNQIIWYDLNKWGKTLSPNTKYYYQFYIIYDNVTYKTTVHSFSTAGSISISPQLTYVTLTEGDTQTLSVTVQPSGLSVVWSSTDTSVVTVDQQGRITAKNAGSAMVTAEASQNGKTAVANFAITVNATVKKMHVMIVGNYDYPLTEEEEEYNENIIRKLFALFSIQIGEDKKPHPGMKNDTNALACAMRYRSTTLGETPDVHYYLDVTKNYILTRIRDNFQNSTDDDINFLYLGGHGRIANHNLCLYNNEEISPSDLINAFSGIKGKNVIIVSACYSGKYASQLAGNGFYVLTSSAESQESWNYSANGDSSAIGDCNERVTTFGYYFLKGIGYNAIACKTLSTMAADANGDNKVTLREIYNYAYPLVYNDTKDNPDNKDDSSQIIQISLPDNKDIVIYQRGN